MSTIRERLGEAIQKWGSVRRFAARMGELEPRPPGSSRQMIHRYLAEGGPTPPLEFVEAAAKVLSVRREWLTTGEGERTIPATAGASIEVFLTEDVFAGVADAFGAGAERLLRVGTRRAAIIQAWDRLSGLVNVRDVDLGRAIGRALWQPFDDLDLNLGNLPDADLTDYTFATCAALGRLSAMASFNSPEGSR